MRLYSTISPSLLSLLFLKSDTALASNRQIAEVGMIPVSFPCATGNLLGFACDVSETPDQSVSDVMMFDIQNGLGTVTCTGGETPNLVCFPDPDAPDFLGICDSCHRNADCLRDPLAKGGYICACSRGYKGDGTFVCGQKDECSEDDAPCPANSYCIDHSPDDKEHPFYVCACLPGFTAGSSSNEFGPEECLDKQECGDESSNTCDKNVGICTNVLGSFVCSCPSDFTLQADNSCTTLPDIINKPDEDGPCVPNPCNDRTQECVASLAENDPDKKPCICKRGFFSPSGVGGECFDEKECDSAIANTCHEQATCQDLDGSFLCFCRDGWEGNGKTCSDINECLINKHNCDSTEICKNTEGSFECAPIPVTPAPVTPIVDPVVNPGVQQSSPPPPPRNPRPFVIGLHGLNYFDDAASPQAQALEWILADPTFLAMWNLSDRARNSIDPSLEVRTLQRVALATIWYNREAGCATWGDTDSWLSGDNECEWGENSEIDCNPNGEVEGLVLDSCLVAIPGAAFASLPSLTILEVFSNTGLTTGIPSELSSMVQLEELNLSNNGLSGEIPATLSALSNLAKLSLSGNSLSGSTPESLCTHVEPQVDCSTNYCSCCVDLSDIKCNLDQCAANAEANYENAGVVGTFDGSDFDLVQQYQLLCAGEFEQCQDLPDGTAADPTGANILPFVCQCEDAYDYDDINTSNDCSPIKCDSTDLSCDGRQLPDGAGLPDRLVCDVAGGATETDNFCKCNTDAFFTLVNGICHYDWCNAGSIAAATERCDGDGQLCELLPLEDSRRCICDNDFTKVSSTNSDLTIVCKPTCSVDTDCSVSPTVCVEDGTLSYCDICATNDDCDNDEHVCRDNGSGVNACDTCTDSNQCSGSNSMCVNGACIECNTSDDCTSAGDVCRDDKTCGPCTLDTHCGAAVPYCASGTCGECSSATHCTASNPVCFSGQCKECSLSSQCEAYPNAVCSSNTCVACADIWSQVGDDIDGEAGNVEFGRAISISSDGLTVAIAANKVNALTSYVQVHHYDGTAWVQRGPNFVGEANDDSFGSSVSLSLDGLTLAIGARLNDGNGGNSGHVQVFRWDGGSNAWQKLGADIDGQERSDNSGISVSLSSDGNTVAVGAINNDGGSSTINLNMGHARVLDFASGAWTVRGDIPGETDGDKSGISVSLSADGNTVAVGADLNDDAGTDAGHARVHDWDATNSVWVQRGDDFDGEAAGDKSGSSVSLSSDGTTIAIGAYKNDGVGAVDTGHVRVYTWVPESGGWIRRGVDIDGEAAGDESGRSVSLSSDGTTLAIGAPRNGGNGANAGHARIYKWEGPTEWTQIGGDIDAEERSDFSGWAVALSQDGNTVAVSAFNNDVGGTIGTNRGHIRIFEAASTCDDL